MQGFQERQYSYSADQQKTLIVPYDAIKNITDTNYKRDLTKKKQLPEVEARNLMKLTNGN